jgi:P-type conjugative transfer protein TrbG
MTRWKTLPLCGLSLLALSVSADAQSQSIAAPAPASATATSPPQDAAPVPAIVATPEPPMPSPPHRRGSRPRPPTRAEARVAQATRSATREPAAAGFVNAVQVYPYSEGSIYRVYTAPERVTDIALQPGETLVAVAAGDTVRWVIGDTSSGSGETRRTHVLAKPFSAGLSTNLLITTDRRSYHLALTSTAGIAMASLSWTYPQDALIAIQRRQAEAQAAAPVASGLAVESLNFAYAITGDSAPWRPLRAFDDGRQTFIQFPPTLGVGEAPPLFVVDERGEAQLVNYRLQGRFYVVDRLFDAAELRLGTRRQQVVRISRVADGGRRRRRS